jgi:hypothetical protein
MRVQRGSLHATPYRGIYAVGHARLSPESLEFAAVLAAGDGSTLFGRSAGHSWGLGARPAAPSLSVPGRRRIRNLDVHRVTLAPFETTWRHGLPVTTPGRTLADLATMTSEAELQEIVRRAGSRHASRAWTSTIRECSSSISMA